MIFAQQPVVDREIMVVKPTAEVNWDDLSGGEATTVRYEHYQVAELFLVEQSFSCDCQSKLEN